MGIIDIDMNAVDEFKENCKLRQLAKDLNIQDDGIPQCVLHFIAFVEDCVCCMEKLRMYLEKKETDLRSGLRGKKSHLQGNTIRK